MTDRRAIVSTVRRYLVAVLIIAVASAIRPLFFAGLGRGIPYLTYYPAVMLAALYGGFPAGLLATVTSILLSFFWVQRGYLSSVETLAIIVFALSCTMISLITEAMRRARARAALAQQRAESANRAKSVFLASMSHELRTPLNAILGFSSLMRSDASMSREHQQMLDIINRSGANLLGLLNSVLDMSRIEAGGMALENSAFDPRAMMQDIAGLMRQRAEAKGLQLALEMPAEGPGAVLADEAKLRQVVINLVGNAVKFTLQGGVALRLASRPTDESHRLMLVIEVEDSGIGIAPEDQQRIFEPFVQLGRTSDQKGTGLGLAITRQFVELMGGVIRVESSPGKGSMFRIELPVEPVEATAIVQARTLDARIPHMAPGQPEYRVLVVEDQVENRELLRRLLKQTGFSVRTAENGAEAVEEFRSWKPQFVWMDWRMPVADGLEATQRIRTLEGGREVKIAVLSASVLKEEREQVLAAGADDFVSKPLEFDKIYDCMTRLLGVQLIHDEASAPEGMRPPTDLDREAMAALPPSLRSELSGALVSLDPERVAALIVRVADMNPSLGAVLEEYAGQFRYTPILQALQSGADRESKEADTE